MARAVRRRVFEFVFKHCVSSARERRGGAQQSVASCNLSNLVCARQEIQVLMKLQCFWNCCFKTLFVFSHGLAVTQTLVHTLRRGRDTSASLYADLLGTLANDVSFVILLSIFFFFHFLFQKHEILLND